MTSVAIAVASRAERRDPLPERVVDFEGLLGREVWNGLPAAVRLRFGHESCARPHVYAGDMVVRASTVGFLIAQLCRLIGTPLAPWRGEAVPVSVDVWTDARGALVWDRVYRFEGRQPVAVSSRKIVSRRGLVEIVKGGLGMALDLTAEEGALHFRSTGYFLELGHERLRLPIPGWLTPGRAHVIHQDEGPGEDGRGRFRFSLRFVHPLFGETIFQEGVFADPE